MIPVKLKMVAVKWASNGTPYALSTCIMYGLKTTTAQNSIKKLKLLASKNGLNVRICRNSWSLSENVAFTWRHRIDCSAQESHGFCANAMWFWSRVNSSWTSSGDTQPRNHCMDFSASFGRFLINNQFGDSGIWFWAKHQINRKLVATETAFEWIDLQSKWRWQW